MEKMWRIYGALMEILWNICVENQHTGKLQTGKYQRRDTMEWYAKATGRTEHATENHRLGKHRKRQGGTNWGCLGNCRNNRG